MRFSDKVVKELIAWVALLGAFIALVSLFHENNILIAVSLIILWLVVMKFLYKKHDIYFFVTGAAVGTIAETISIYSGVWEYANPTYLGIPLWLPIAWGFAAVLIRRIAEILAESKE